MLLMNVGFQREQLIVLYRLVGSKEFLSVAPAGLGTMVVISIPAPVIPPPPWSSETSADLKMMVMHMPSTCPWELQCISYRIRIWSPAHKLIQLSCHVAKRSTSHSQRLVWYDRKFPNVVAILLFIEWSWTPCLLHTWLSLEDVLLRETSSSPCTIDEAELPGCSLLESGSRFFNSYRIQWSCCPSSTGCEH